jgi:hypothetical protein
MKNTDPLMDAKLKSKIHLPNTFLIFCAVFLRVWLQSFQKVQNMTQKKFFLEKNPKRYK